MGHKKGQIFKILIKTI